jgi:hypothetical protein
VVVGGLYNLRSGKIVPGASLKHQACRDWFYGRAGRAQQALGHLEGGASTGLRRIIEAARPPKRYSDEHRVLASTEPAAEALRPAVMETPVILDLKIKLLHAAAKGVCRAQAISGPS